MAAAVNQDARVARECCRIAGHRDHHRHLAGGELRRLRLRALPPGSLGAMKGRRCYFREIFDCDLEWHCAWVQVSWHLTGRHNCRDTAEVRSSGADLTFATLWATLS
jgi:hypothetical protein